MSSFLSAFIRSAQSIYFACKYYYLFMHFSALPSFSSILESLAFLNPSVSRFLLILSLSDSNLHFGQCSFRKFFEFDLFAFNFITIFAFLAKGNISFEYPFSS